METVGSLIDKLCVNELKIYHTGEKAGSADPKLREECRERLGILRSQRAALVSELQGIFDRVAAGEAPPAPFRQLKMYNDKRFGGGE